MDTRLPHDMRWAGEMLVAVVSRRYDVHMTWGAAPCLVVLCAACVGCGVGFDSAPNTEGGGGGAPGGSGGSSIAPGVGGGGSGASGGVASAGGAGGVGGAGGSGGALTNDGLLTRYYIDEATMGQAPTQLEDSADAPLPLAIAYGAEMSFFEDGNRGLRWTTSSADGRASAAVDGSKITMLHGSTTGTIEVVLQLAAVSPDWSRISHIGSSSELGRFTLLSAQADTLMVRWNSGSQLGSWNIGLTGLGRVVVHVVLDTDLASPADRARLYVDGVVQDDTAGTTPPNQGATIDLATGRHYVLGNREIGGRTYTGALYYAALYTTALDANTVAQHAAVLSAGDDGP